MTDLVAWLRQQLDIDQAEAYAAMPVPLQHSSAFNNDGTPTFGGDHQCGYPYARVLRQVQAHRAILADLAAVIEDDEGHNYFSDGHAGLDVAKRTLRLLASIYSDRDGYNPEWSA